MSQAGSGVCDGDLLLLEKPDPAYSTDSAHHSGRFVLERELCGVNSSSSELPVQDSILKLTFLGGSPLVGPKAGFVMKIRAFNSTGGGELFHVSCTGTDPALDTREIPATTSAGKDAGYASSLINWIKSQGGALPPNFDPSQLPAELRGTLTGDQLRQVVAATSQRRVGDRVDKDINGNSLGRGFSDGSGRHDMVQDGSQSTESTPDVLSGVVASLASVILIMASVGALLFYRRRKRNIQKRMEESTIYDSEYYGDGTRSGIYASNDPRYQRRQHSTQHRLSNSRFAIYGRTFARMFSRPRTPTSRDRQEPRVDESEIYSVPSSRSVSNDQYNQGLAQDHQKPKPPTRRAPRPPLRPPPVLHQSHATTSPTEPQPSPTAPPRKYKSIYSKHRISSSSEHIYDNADEKSATQVQISSNISSIEDLSGSENMLETKAHIDIGEGQGYLSEGEGQSEGSDIDTVYIEAGSECTQKIKRTSDINEASVERDKVKNSNRTKSMEGFQQIKKDEMEQNDELEEELLEENV